MKELRIKNIHPSLHEEIVNISKNLGITVTAFLKPKLVDIANSYSKEMKRKRQN